MLLKTLELPVAAPCFLCASFAAMDCSQKQQGKRRKKLIAASKTLTHPAAVYILKCALPPNKANPFSPKGVTTVWIAAKMINILAH